jgi:hypothetical protein
VWTSEEHDDGDSLDTATIIISSDGRPASAISGTKIPNLELYHQHLAPLAELEDTLIRLLSSPDGDEAVHVGPTPPAWESHELAANRHDSSQHNGRPTPTIFIPQHKHAFSISAPNTAGGTPAASPSDLNAKSSKKEVAVHFTTNWKKAFSLGGKEKSPKSAHTGEIAGWWEDPEDPVHALNACAPAMLQLWKDPNVKQRLWEKRVRLEESSGL